MFREKQGCSSPRGWCALAVPTTVALIAALVLGFLVPSEATASEGEATADSYVRSDWNANFGTSTLLYTRSSAPVATSYLRFNVSGVSGTVTSATLNVYAKGSTSFGLEVRPVLGGWEESTLK